MASDPTTKTPGRFWTWYEGHPMLYGIAVFGAFGILVSAIAFGILFLLAR